MTAPKVAISVLLASASGLSVTTAHAHGFGERYDLPVPLNFFLVGAAATVALSFAVIGLFVRRRPESYSYPRYNLLGPRPLAAVLTSRVFLIGIQAISVGLFLLVISTALFGTVRPIDNLSPTLVWIIWWVGMGYVAALLGHLWMLINPWKIVFEWGERLMGDPGTQGTGMFSYPERWDVWPALVLFVIFAWVENVYSGAARPFNLGILILLYSMVTWGGMLAFGKHQWLRHGEPFSVLFGFFARFSPTEVAVTNARLCGTCEVECELTDGRCIDCYACFERAEAGQRELNLRPYAVGLANPGRVSTATALFVVLALATVTFDGFTATPTWGDIQTAAYSTASIFGQSTLDAIDTAGLVVLPLIFLAVYLVFSWAIGQLSGGQVPVAEVARRFVFSLVPIALAYNLAHFLSLLLVQGQLIIPLASDPFGVGWDLFGTADYKLDIGIIGARFVWFMSVGAIVAGHIVAVYIAHVVALRTVPDHSSALRGQYPMLLLMVSYTATSLWIIAQPVVN
jgi:hypothetical protein